MTVAELREALREFDDDAEVLIVSGAPCAPLKSVNLEEETSESGTFVYVHKEVFLSSLDG